MRGATKCAATLKKVFKRLRDKHGKVSLPATGDPISQLLLGILSRDVPEAKARAALDQLRSSVVDYNELRVIPSVELAETLGDYPQAREKAADLSRALNKIFFDEHDVSLDRIGKLPKKEMLAYLESIDGLDAYSQARVRLLGFESHAVPLDEAMWAWARDAAIVDDKCPLAEAQGFLERQLKDDEALEFIALAHKEAWADFADAVAAREVEPISSQPIEWKTSHMLADLTPKESPALALDDESEAFEDVDAAAKRDQATLKKVKAAKRKATRKASGEKPNTKKATKKKTTGKSNAAAKKKTTKSTAKRRNTKQAKSTS
jgi:endonuclease III